MHCSEPRIEPFVELAGAVAGCPPESFPVRLQVLNPRMRPNPEGSCTPVAAPPIPQRLPIPYTLSILPASG